MKTLKLIAILAITTVLHSNAFAQLGSKLKSNKALQKLEQQKPAEAENLINEALEADAANPEILYNWASTTLNSVRLELQKAPKDKPKELSEEQKKKLEAAFAELGKLKAQTKSLPQTFSAKELYYQSAHINELLGRKQEALKDYYTSLQADSSQDSKELSKFNEKIKINISRLLTPEDSSSDDGSGESGSQQGDSKENSENGEGKGEGDKQNSSGQPQQSRREPEFSGTDVNESQAQQILNSVSNQDRQVQQRKGQQQSKQNMQGAEEGEVSTSESDKPW